MTNAFKILNREASQYASDGYFVIQNNAAGHVQISDDGLHIKSGQTMAISDISDICQRSLDKGLLKLVAKPSSLDGAKKNKKKSQDSGEVTEIQPVANIPVVEVSASSPETQPAPEASAQEQAPLQEESHNIQSNEVSGE